jgi:hypothetical protein
VDDPVRISGTLVFAASASGRLPFVARFRESVKQAGRSSSERSNRPNCRFIDPST